MGRSKVKAMTLASEALGIPARAIGAFLKEKVFAKRNPGGVAQFEARKEIYEKYTLTKAYPTIDEEDLDEIIDEEWSVFKDPVEEEEIPIVKRKRTGLFLTTLNS